MDRIYAHENYVDIAIQICPINLSLSNSQFSDGGGIEVHPGLYISGAPCSSSRTFVIEMDNSYFSMYHGIKMYFVHPQNFEISFKSCLFSALKPLISPGIQILSVPSTQKVSNEQKILIHNVTIENHSISNGLFSLLNFYSIHQLEITDILILNNGYGGLALYDSVAHFRGNNTFINNSAVNGGGISVYGNSYIFLDANSTLLIINNTANHFGGAIYVSQEQHFFRWCFMQSDYPFPEIRIEGNIAGYTGANLYGGNIDTCFQGNFSMDHSWTDAFGVLANTSHCYQRYVSSEARYLAFCEEQCTNITKTEQIVTAFPGTEFNVSIAALGQFNGLTQANIHLQSDQVFVFEILDESGLVNSTCTSVIRSIRVKRTNTTGNITLTISNYMYYINPDALNDSSRSSGITIMIDLLPCPAGFILTDGSNMCDCAKSITHYAQCDIKSQSIKKQDNSWISTSNDSIMVFYPCPFDYCNNKTFSVYNPDGQCDYNRSRTLCGDCIHGYSLILGSNQCMDCTDQVWKLPAILLGSALAGIGLVTLLITLNLTVSV